MTIKFYKTSNFTGLKDEKDHRQEIDNDISKLFLMANQPPPSTGVGTPGGANTYVQFNDSGAFGGEASFVYDKVNDRLGLGTTSPSQKLHVAGGLNVGNILLENDGAIIWNVSTGTILDGGLRLDSNNDFNIRTANTILFRNGGNNNVLTMTADGNIEMPTNSVPTARSLYTTAQASANKAAAALSVFTGTGNGSGAGGALNISSGDGGATGAGGAMAINVGDGGATSGNGGNFSIDSGDANAAAASGNGGYIHINAGDASGGTGTGGSIVLTAGGAGSTSGNAGDIQFFAGLVGSSGNAGTFYFEADDGTGTNKNGGGFGVFLGAPTGSGTRGLFYVAGSSVTGVSVEQVLAQFKSFSMGVSSGSTIANQRTFQFLAPTINGVAGGGTETVTNGATVYIDAAPSGANITITNAYSLWVDAGIARFDGALECLATVSKYNSVATAGLGVPAIYGSGRSVAQTAAVASVATYTVGASDGSFEVSANVLVTTATLHNFTVTCAYTDEGNTSRTLTLNFSNLAGTFITAITNAAGAVPSEGVPMHIRCKASTSITIATTGTFTTVTYNVEGIIKQTA